MSINLNVRGDVTGDLNIPQTPTKLTYTLMTTKEGTIAPEFVGGAAARRVLQQIKMWELYSTNGMWGSKEELDDAREWAQKLAEDIDNFLNENNKISVYIT